jgi:transposase
VNVTLKAMAAGQRDPQVLAGLARTTMRAKRDELAEALDGMFDDHHGELAGMLLDQIAFPGQRTTQLAGRAAELTAAMPGAWGIDGDGTTSSAGPGTQPVCLRARALRLAAEATCR